jgi:hypothetical protein
LKDEFTLRNNGVPQKTRKLQDIILEENSAGARDLRSIRRRRSGW